MSLTVYLQKFKIIKCKYEKYAQLEFRDNIKYSVVLLDDRDIIHVNQKFVWELSEPITPGEVLTVHLVTRRFKKTRKLGVYRLGLDLVTTDGQISVVDTLLSERNEPVAACIEMDVFYKIPHMTTTFTHEDESKPRVKELPPRHSGRAQLPQIPPQRIRSSQPPHLMPSVNIIQGPSGQGPSRRGSQANIPPAIPGPSSQSYVPPAIPGPSSQSYIPPAIPGPSSQSYIPPAIPGPSSQSYIPRAIPGPSSQSYIPRAIPGPSSQSYIPPAVPGPSSRSYIPPAVPGPSSRSYIPPAIPGPSSQSYIPPDILISSSPSSAPQSDGDDDNTLENLQKNIETLETSIKMKNEVVDKDNGDLKESRARRLKIAGKRFLRRGLSLGRQSDIIASDSPPKQSALKIMKSLMRLGRRSRSIGDNEHALLPMPGTSTDIERAMSQISLSSDDNVLVDISHGRGPTTISKAKSMFRAMVDDTSEKAALKAADFQVCITIIEARQLAGLNMDPVVKVQVDDMVKFTSVRESTNCPYYNEYFVFDHHMPPVVLLDKMIVITVLQGRRLWQNEKVLGSFKLDVATVWNQPDRQFYHRWALLTDPDDIGAGAKGYVKCDISVIAKGDPIKIPPKNDKDDDDIEGNLLLPDGVPFERQRARFIVQVHKAEGLPNMNPAVLASLTNFVTGEKQDLVNPFVHVSFAGMIGYTSVKQNTYNPVWNEQIVFTEMFPPLCHRIKIQLKNYNAVHQSVIGTHFIDLRTISNDGEGGFLPTFGPSYIYIYGSTRNYTILDPHSILNLGIGEGVAYRARLLISIRTEIIDSFDYPLSNVVIENTIPIHEASYEKKEQFFLFGCVYDVNMIDKSLVDDPIQFELSIGNAGNSKDGRKPSLKRPHELDNVNLDELNSDTGYWQSTTPATKATSCGEKHYYYLPYWGTKHCMQVRSIWPDHRRRMYNSNLIANIIDLFDEALADASSALASNEGPDNTCLAGLKSALEAVSAACAKYVKRMNSSPPLGNTKLDYERHKFCISEVEKISVLTKGLKALITRNSLKERLRTAYSYLDRLKLLCEDAQQSMPDIFLWMTSQGKRLAYQRINARDIIYSETQDETGRMCGKIQSLFLKWPGKKASHPSGWAVPAKVNVYFWLGVIKDKKHYVDGLPKGFEYSNELKNADLLRVNAPTSIIYNENHVFQMRAYIYQARSLIGSDSSGLSDPFARVVIEECSATTKVIDETLSPTWDELLLFENITLYSTMDQIKTDPPIIVVEIFDRDKVGKAEYIGRTAARPHVKDFSEIYETPQFIPKLEWYEITRGDNKAGELLATFELLEIPPKDSDLRLPELPRPKECAEDEPIETRYPVPKGIRPTLSRYRVEVLFWGVRDLKRIHLLTVDKPRVDIECSGHIIYSTVIESAKLNPNFTTPVKFIDVELPDQDLYRPPLSIRVVDCRSFGRATLVGTHIINSIHKYCFIPMSRREREIEERKKSMIQLHNIDLEANCIIQDDVYTVDNDRESCPLLIHDGRVTVPYGSRRPGVAKKALNLDGQRRKRSTDSVLDDDDNHKDWWTKYFASYDFMIEEEKENKKQRQRNIQSPQLTYVDETRSPRDEIQSPRFERANRQSSVPNRSKSLPVSTKNTEIPRSALTRIIPHELEAVPEYEGFKEWLQSFELYRGKKTSTDSEDDTRIVGVFKGAIKVYKWPLSKTTEPVTDMGFDLNKGFFQGLPKNEPIHVLVRVYIVKATDLHPMDMNGKADPYIVLQLGSKKINDKENYVSKQLNPVFGKCFEIEATIPHDSTLTVQVYDWDLLGSDELIGETKIDLENRYYSRHRATCGLPKKYEEQGYNRWRDAMKPTQILNKLCKDGKIDPPIYEYSRVKVGRTIFNMPLKDTELFSDPDTIQEQMALTVLRRWEEIPRIGTKLVTEHVETRTLYNPNKPGIEQGRLQMWVDMFPMDMPLPGPPVDISPRTPKAYEMRVIIWNTDDVVLEDDAFFTGEKMSDIYVKGWVKGPEDCQSTDTHYRSLTGEGNFNWRFIYRFEYLEAEERILITRKESVFSWDESESKIPARLELQVWDSDHFTSDDFLGALTLDLNRFPRGAKSSKLCTLQMLSNEGLVPMVNIFKQKRVKGWWPFYTKGNNEEMELTGKVEAEIHLLTREEADRAPAGLGRSEPDPLDKPNRPDSSFAWLFNPLKSLRYIMWHNYKWDILLYGFIILVIVLILGFILAIPGYLVKKWLGA